MRMRSPVPEMLVLAGGFGTRLREAVVDVPKPLAPVVGRPFLYYLLENWYRQGARKFTFLLHHQAELISAFLEQANQTGYWRDCEIRTLTEPTPLGTGGAVGNAVRRLRLTGSFLVTNADTWLGSGASELAAEEGPTLAVVHVPNSERYGSVKSDGHYVTAFTEKKATVGEGWINAGIYNLHAKHFLRWDGFHFSLEHDLFPDLVSKGELKIVRLRTEFIDIGVPDDYFRFCRWIETDRQGTL